MNPITISDTLKALSVNPPTSLWESLTEPNTIIALTAVLLSIVALGFTACWNRRTFRMTKKHNMFSVRPLIDVYNDHRPNYYSLFLKNVGMGPGIFTKIYFAYQGQHFDSLYELINKVAREKLKWLPGHYSNYLAGQIIGQGQQLVLFESSAVKPDMEMINSAFDGIRMYLIYTDIYNEPFIYDDFLISNLKKIDPEYNIRVLET